MTPARQLVLELPHRTALGRDDFLVTASNATAVAMIDRWPSWPSSAVLLAGPAGSGKTHLAEVWRQSSGAARASAAGLGEADLPKLLGGRALVVEDAPGPRLDETALFHLLNHARQIPRHLSLVAHERRGLTPRHPPERDADQGLCDP